MKPRLLQVANVGNICGGTAACAWSVTRALPGFEHVVAFLSPITEETRSVFGMTRLERWSEVTATEVRRLWPDVVLLHNTARPRVRGTWPMPTVQYLHSAITVSEDWPVVCCSRWLAAATGRRRDRVLWQGVPRAIRQPRDPSDREVVIGRLCTPTAAKWSPELVPFYREMARRQPRVRWEFVGCPVGLRRELEQACGGRVRCWSAGWGQRRLLTRWDGLLQHQPGVTESFGRTVAEGLRVGCVPMVDRRGGFIEQLQAGGGWLCETEDDFAAAVERLIDPGERVRVRQEGLRVAEAWSLERFARRLLDLFDAVVSGGLPT